jgi:hypothetical protein
MFGVQESGNVQWIQLTLFSVRSCSLNYFNNFYNNIIHQLTAIWKLAQTSPVFLQLKN